MKHLFKVDKPIIKLYNSKLDGLESTGYYLQPTGDDEEDILPQGPNGTSFMRMKVVRYYPSSTRCVWLRKSFVEVPFEGNLVFTQNDETGAVSKDVSNDEISDYVEITLFERKENEIKNCGIMRLRTKNGFKIMNGEKFVTNISTKTDAELALG